jgi:hypothetical protein
MLRLLILSSFVLLFTTCVQNRKEAKNLDDDSSKLEILDLAPALQNRIRVLMPKSFKQMSDQELEIKYPRSGSLPQEAYSNESGTVSLAFNHTSNKLSPADLPDFRQSFARQFKGTLGIEFKGSSIKNINGRDFAILEFISPAMDTNIYNLMFLTSLDNRLLICTFNCVQSEMEKWKPTSQQILNSVQVIE